MRQFFDDVRKVSHYQIRIPKHLRKEVLYRIHNSPTSGHVGIVRTAEEFRRRFHFSGLSEFLTDFIRNCLSCSTLKSPEPATAPSTSAHLIGTAFSGNYDANWLGWTIPIANLQICTRGKRCEGSSFNFLQHSYIPTTLLSDLRTNFVAKLLHELTDLLEIQLQHASLKHPQTIGVVERPHSALNWVLKVNTDKKWNTWYRYVDLATFIHNTSYHSSIRCTPSSLFHGREPIEPIDLRFLSHILANK